MSTGQQWPRSMLGHDFGDIRVPAKKQWWPRRRDRAGAPPPPADTISFFGSLVNVNARAIDLSSLTWTMGGSGVFSASYSGSFPDGFSFYDLASLDSDSMGWDRSSELIGTLEIADTGETNNYHSIEIGIVLGSTGSKWAAQLLISSDSGSLQLIKDGSHPGSGGDSMGISPIPVDDRPWRLVVTIPGDLSVVGAELWGAGGSRLDFVTG
jgi:hypothetical protein